MSIRKNTWNLDGHYDLTKSEENSYVGSGLLFAFGTNTSGSSGQNNRVPYSSPVQVSGTSWSILSVGGQGNLAIKSDGTLWAWGANSSNQSGVLGQNDVIPRSSPTQVPGTQWSSVSNNYFHAYAIKTDGTLYSWGSNNYGVLGLNGNVQRSSPTQVPGTQWSTVGSHTYHYDTSMAFKSDGTLWIWGHNNFGQLGQNNNTTRYSSPVQIPGTSWSSATAGERFGSAIKTDGTLWTWGIGPGGSLGLNDVVQRSSPTQVPGTQWSFITTGKSHSIGIKSDGTLWTWGNSSSGRLGHNDDPGYYSSPKQVPGTQWQTAGAGNAHTFAIKTDGEMWAWGSNGGGKLGLNNIISYSSPIQVPGTWSSVGGGDAMSAALSIQ